MATPTHLGTAIFRTTHHRRIPPIFFTRRDTRPSASLLHPPRVWSSRRESNPHALLGGQTRYRYITTAYWSRRQELHPPLPSAYPDVPPRPGAKRGVLQVPVIGSLSHIIKTAGYRVGRSPKEVPLTPWPSEVFHISSGKLCINSTPLGQSFSLPVETR